MNKNNALPLFDPAFTIFAPSACAPIPLILNVPHAGREYPSCLLAASPLDPLTLRRSEDAYVDHLVMGALRFGATVMCAHFPRAWLDVNREPYELDPMLFEGALPPFANTQSARVKAGLGTIPRLVGENFPIYHRPLPLSEGIERIKTVYEPYHRALNTLIQQVRVTFGYCVILDCHSMPSPQGHKGQQVETPQIILGDRYGAACSEHLMDTVEGLFTAQRYHVVRNRPYAGGYITHTYGRPAVSQHVIQIEVARSLYMNEKTLEPHDGFARLEMNMMHIFKSFIERLPKGRFACTKEETPYPLAAE
jgi:N-formylglutamate amidohydrolase